MRDLLLGVMASYHPQCLDPRGGFFEIGRDGRADPTAERSLVGTARMVVNHAIASLHSGGPEHRAAVRHGLAYLREAFREGDGYAWTLQDRATRRCYGLVFVALAYARAMQCGVAEARGWLHETWELIDQRFLEPQHDLYADQAGAEWTLDPYRGQNSNMHACEALLAAFEATGESQYLDGAERLADRVANRLAAQTGGLVWEHFCEDWKPDFDFEARRPDRYRAWGFQPGHQAEWAKLLLVLERHLHKPWHLARAKELFDRALALGWDDEHEGVVLSCAPDDSWHDTDKYAWVQAECLAAAGLLAPHDPRYASWRDRLWEYAWRRFADRPALAWMRVLRRDHMPHGDGRGYAGRTDYHIVNACHELLVAEQDQKLAERLSRNVRGAV